MELFRGVNIDWLGKKWYFLGFSLIFSVAGVLSLLFWHHLPLGVDFKGGTHITAKFDQAPDPERIRRALDQAGLHDAQVQTYGPAVDVEVIIALPQRETNEASLDAGRSQIVSALETNYSATGAAAATAGGVAKLDFDNASSSAVNDFLTQRAVLGANASSQQVAQAAQTIVKYRDQQKGGLLSNFDELASVASPAIISSFKDGAFLSGFTIRNVEVVGPQVGAQLRNQALRATAYSLAGMLVYLWFRFELIYGIAAVVAVFHDTLITIGAFSLTNREISITVIAAILTLIGYSMNDTIVVFDRIRENLRARRKETLSEVVNRSINQTLSRTVLTSGLTFLTVLCLYIFGGEVLRNFSFALVIGILIGTYSSIAVAAPMLVAYQDWRTEKGKTAVLPAGKKARA